MDRLIPIQLCKEIQNLIASTGLEVEVTYWWESDKYETCTIFAKYEQCNVALTHIKPVLENASIQHLATRIILNLCEYFHSHAIKLKETYFKLLRQFEVEIRADSPYLDD